MRNRSWQTTESHSKRETQQKVISSSRVTLGTLLYRVHTATIRGLHVHASGSIVGIQDDQKSHYFSHYYRVSVQKQSRCSIKEETDRREGKGRRCCLGDGIHSIQCHTTDLAQRWFEEKDDSKNGRQRMSPEEQRRPLPSLLYVSSSIWSKVECKEWQACLELHFIF